MSLVLLLAATAALGRLAGRVLPMGSGVEGWFFRMAAGLTGSAIVVLAVGSHSLASAQIALFTLVMAGVVGELAGWVYDRPVRYGSGNYPANMPDAEPPKRLKKTFLEWVCLFLAGMAITMTFFAAWAPVSDPEATGGALALAQGHARAGGLRFLPNLSDPGGQMLMPALYAATFYGSGERPVMLLSWAVGLLACLGAYVLGRRMAGPIAGSASGALFACMPVFFDQSTAVSAHMAQALFTMAALAALFAWFDEGDYGRLIFAGGMAGAAFGAGYACVLFALLLPVVVLFGPRQENGELQRGDRMRGALLLAGVTLLVSLPFLLRAWLTTGSPVYPWLQSFFSLRENTHPYAACLASDPAYVRDGFRLDQFLFYPWQVVMRPSQFGGWTESAGGMIIALGIPALLWGGRRVWIVALLAASGMAGLFFANRGALAVLPYLATLAAVSGVTVAQIPKTRAAVAVALVAGCLFGLGLHAIRLRDQLPVLMGKENKDAYLNRRAPRHSVWENVNRHAAQAPGVRVLVIGSGAYFCDAPVYANMDGLRTLSPLLGIDRLKWLKNQGIGLIVVPEDLLGEKSPLPQEVRDIVAMWKSNPVIFPVLQTMDIPRVAAGGVEKVHILAMKQDF